MTPTDIWGIHAMRALLRDYGFVLAVTAIVTAYVFVSTLLDPYRNLALSVSCFRALSVGGCN